MFIQTFGWELLARTLFQKQDKIIDVDNQQLLTTVAWQLFHLFHSK